MVSFVRFMASRPCSLGLRLTAGMRRRRARGWYAIDVAGHVISDLRAVEAYATGRDETASVPDPRSATGDDPLGAWRAARADMMAALDPQRWPGLCHSRGVSRYR
jgi:hypothetical protein